MSTSTSTTTTNNTATSSSTTVLRRTNNTNRSNSNHYTSNRTKSTSQTNGGSSVLLPIHHHIQHSNAVMQRRRKHSTKKKSSSWFESGGVVTTKTIAITFLLSLAGLGAILHHRHNGYGFANNKKKPHTATTATGDGVVGENVVHHRNLQLRQLKQPKQPIEGIYDVCIVGAGPAGLTAALFASRAGLNVKVLGSSTGMLSETKHLDNFPSFFIADQDEGVTAAGGGQAWLDITKKQALSFGAEFAPSGTLANSLSREKRIQGGNNKKDDNGAASEDDECYFSLQTPLETIRSWSVIVASGAKGRQLGLPQEQLLWGNSLHSCAICDGHLYLDKTVLVVGGGDSAIDAAVLLSRYAKKVLVVHRRKQLSGQNQVSIDVAQSTPNIEFLMPYAVKEWEATSSLTTKATVKGSVPTTTTNTKLIGARIKRVDGGQEGQGEENSIAIDGAFVMIGAIPNTEWLKKGNSGIQLDKEGLISLVNNKEGTTTSTSTTESTVSGVFASGEVADSVYKQAITASSSGAQAAIDAERWLREKRGVVVHHSRRRQQNNNNNNNNKASSSQTTKKEANVPVAAAKEERRLPSSNTDDGNCDMTTKDCINTIVNKYPVVVFSKPWCPYCRKAIETLTLAGVKESHIIDLSTYTNSQVIQQTLSQMTGRRTVPNVFVGGKSIGGGDETVALQRQGKLVEVLIKGGALPKGKGYANNNQEQGESCDLADEDCYHEIVKKYPVLMFSLSWCPECKRSLELLDLIGAPTPHIIDLDDYKATGINNVIRTHMLKSTGRRQVPNLFIGGEYIGGFVRTSEMHERGELLPRFQKVGVM